MRNRFGFVVVIALAVLALSGKAAAQGPTCKLCDWKNTLEGYVCVIQPQPLQDGYIYCRDGGMFYCTLDQPCTPMLALTSANMSGDGSIRGRLGKASKSSANGRKFIRSCEGKIIGRAYTIAAGRAIRERMKTIAL